MSFVAEEDRRLAERQREELRRQEEARRDDEPEYEDEEDHYEKDEYEPEDDYARDGIVMIIRTITKTAIKTNARTRVFQLSRG